MTQDNAGNVTNSTHSAHVTGRDRNCPHISAADYLWFLGLARNTLKERQLFSLIDKADSLRWIQKRSNTRIYHSILSDIRFLCLFSENSIAAKTLAFWLVFGRTPRTAPERKHLTKVSDSGMIVEWSDSDYSLTLVTKEP